MPIIFCNLFSLRIDDNEDVLVRVQTSRKQYQSTVSAVSAYAYMYIQEDILSSHFLSFFFQELVEITYWRKKAAQIDRWKKALFLERVGAHERERERERERKTKRPSEQRTHCLGSQRRSTLYSLRTKTHETVKKLWSSKSS